MAWYTDSEIYGLLEERKEEYEKIESDEYWSEIPPENVPFTYAWFGDDAQRIAVGHLLLSNLEDAQYWFSEAAKLYLKSAEKIDEIKDELEETGVIEALTTLPRRIDSAIYSSCLSNSGELLENSSKESIKLERKYILHIESEQITIQIDDDRYFYTRGLGAATLKEWSLVRECISPLRESISKPDSKRGMHYTAGADFLEGLVESDSHLVEQAIEGMIDWHEKENVIGSEPSGLSSYVCVQALAMKHLAHRQGINTEVESRYIPNF